MVYHSTNPETKEKKGNLMLSTEEQARNRSDRCVECDCTSEAPEDSSSSVIRREGKHQCHVDSSFPFACVEATLLRSIRSTMDTA